MPGRKRGLAVHVLGLLIAVVVLAASVYDNAAGIAQLRRVVAGTEPVTVKEALWTRGSRAPSPTTGRNWASRSKS